MRILNTINRTGLILLVLVAVPFLACALESGDCQDCHADAGMVGEELTIDALKFDNTAHAEVGCPSCHSSVTDAHPDDSSAHEKADCRECHDDVSAEYGNSVHAENALCSDCHNPHRVLGATEVSGHDMNMQCTTCHENGDMQSLHAEWLPQADLHINMLPCITCHSASPEYVITLYLIKRQSGGLFGDFELATYDELKSLVGDKPIQELIDTNSDGYISLAELRMFNLGSENKGLRLQGMMTPEQVSHDFRTQDNRWDCSFCHASGPSAMQVSYLSLVQSDGSFKRVSVEKGAVLDALYGTPDFYMVGSTRSTALNYVGLVIIAGGLVMPIGHGTLRFLTRKNRSKNEEK